jgi:hypothetical protein
VTLDALARLSAWVSNNCEVVAQIELDARKAEPIAKALPFSTALHGTTNRYVKAIRCSLLESISVVGGANGNPWQEGQSGNPDRLSNGSRRKLTDAFIKNGPETSV